MAKKNFKPAVNKAATVTARESKTAGYLFGGLALAAFGISFIADVVDDLTYDYDAPVYDEDATADEE